MWIFNYKKIKIILSYVVILVHRLQRNYFRKYSLSIETLFFMYCTYIEKNETENECWFKRREGKGRHAGWEDELEWHIKHLAARMIWRNIFGENIHFKRVVVWCGVNRMIIFLKYSMNSAKKPLFYYSFTSNHLGAKYLVLESIPSPKQQQRPLPSLLYFFILLHMLVL